MVTLAIIWDILRVIGLFVIVLFGLAALSQGDPVQALVCFVMVIVLMMLHKHLSPE